MNWLTPDWPAPASVKACVTTREGGVSEAPFDSLNLGDHVDDRPEAVAENRRRLTDHFSIQPAWLQQVHGIAVAHADPGIVATADASWTATPGIACAAMTADCLPALFCDRAGTRVAAAHAGWRGLCDGVLEQTLQQFPQPAHVMAWLGPAIGPSAFEVGDEVRQAFVQKDAKAQAAFVAVQAKPGKWLADLYQLATMRLNACGVTQIYGGGFCTYTDAKRFYSYRRDGQTGRMASCIWID